MSQFVKFLRKNAFYEEFYDSDNLLSVCRGCSQKAWLIDDIEHSKGCEVEPVLKTAGILDKESTETVAQQLKAKIAALSKKLDKYNYYGAKYHIREINEVVEEMQQLSAI